MERKDNITREEYEVIINVLNKIGCESLAQENDFSVLLGTPCAEFFDYLPTAVQKLSAAIRCEGSAVNAGKLIAFTRSLDNVSSILYHLTTLAGVLSDVEHFGMKMEEASDAVVKMIA